MGEKKRIDMVIIDDNKLFKLAVKANLEQQFSDKNIKIHVFDIGEKSIERIKRDLPEIIILDYHLDSQIHQAADGIAVLDEIKQINPESKVIMLTGDSNIDVAIKSFLHGASDYVVKNDMEFEKINRSVQRILDAMEFEQEKKRKVVVKNVLLSIAIVLLILNLCFSIDFH